MSQGFATESELRQAASALRILSATAVEKANSGHPGMPLGFADVFVILVAEFLKFYPQNPRWHGRDRLILSAGHGSMLLYAFYYLAGFRDFSIDDIKKFRQLDSKTPGHPEYGAYEAIETTTGPLGQGFGNSVGMAIAAKKYAAKLGADIIDHKIYCIVGDGCLMEGISYEAASIAGHLKLNNLIVLFDDNKITIDGSTDLTISENQLLKFQALGWEVFEVDGHNFSEIRSALQGAQDSDKPVFIACRTTIGYGCSKANSAQSHGAPLGAKALSELKTFLNWECEDFIVPIEILDIWRQFGARNNIYYENWQHKFEHLTIPQKQYLEPFKFKLSTVERINAINIHVEEASRISSSKVIDIIIENEDKVILGSADLSSSIGIKNSHCNVITRDNFGGNFIHFGPREHAMGAIMNGLSLEGFLPIAGTFLIFTDYMRPAIRLASLMGLKVIYIMTHDSIGLGEDGPTHQPVEQLSSLRIIPNLKVFRPSDPCETTAAFMQICQSANHPNMIVLSRQILYNTGLSSMDGAMRGAYFLNQTPEAEISVFATGSEVYIAKQVVDLLIKDGLKVNLVSIISFELFFEQDEDYINQIVGSALIKVAIEAGIGSIWHKIIGSKGLFFGVQSFGKSAPCEDLYSYFGLTANNIYSHIKNKYENRN